jgi:hypothetical protein
VAVTFNTTLAIQKQQQLLAPPMAAAPVAVALENANSLYRVHQPALLSFCPIHTPAIARDCSFTVGCRPSQDGLRYQFAHQVLPGWTGNVTIQVDSGRGDPTAWTTIYGPAAVAVVNGVWLDHRHTGVIGAAEDRIRVIYTSVAGNVLVSHVLAYPDPDPTAVPIAAPYGKQVSGFWPADTALLAAGGPVHTEMVDRCYRNAVAVLTDRLQAVGSLVQEDHQLNAPRLIAPFGTEPVEGWALIGKTRGLLPYQQGAPMGGVDLRPNLRVDCLAKVTAGTTSQRVKVVARGAGGKESQVQLDATDTMQVSTGLLAEVDGAPGAGVDLEFYVRAAAGQQVKVYSVMVSWQPGS